MTTVSDVEAGQDVVAVRTPVDRVLGHGRDLIWVTNDVDEAAPGEQTLRHGSGPG